MDANNYPPLTSSLAGLTSVTRERATIARTRRPPQRITKVASVDAVAPIGERGDDARRRDKRAETPDPININA